MIKDFKFRSASILTETLGEMLLKNIKNELLMSNNQMSVIIPVPLHKKRMRERGFNQSALLAKYIADKTSVPLDCDTLVKIKNTSSQVSAFSRNDRLQNLYESFLIKNPENIKNKTVILVDDVITTGATIIECARTLKRAGCKNIIALVVAH